RVRTRHSDPASNTRPPTAWRTPHADDSRTTPARFLRRHLPSLVPEDRRPRARRALDAADHAGTGGHEPEDWRRDTWQTQGDHHDLPAGRTSASGLLRPED